MKNIDVFTINMNSSCLEALRKIDLALTNQTLFVLDDNDKLIATVTDGDIRRGLINGLDPKSQVIKFANTNFNYIKDEIDVLKIHRMKVEGKKVLPKVDENGHIERVYNLAKLKSLLPIDVVMMAGGRGERLRPLTDKTPKPLLKVGGKPIIEHNIDNLIDYGVENFYITVNYLAEQIVEYFGDGQNKNVSIKCLKETEPMGTIGSVSLIKEFEHDVVLVMNSDLFTNLNYEDFYLNFINEGADMSIASIPYNVSIPYAVLSLDQDEVRAFEEKPTFTYYANAGIYLIKRSLLNSIPVNKSFNATDFIQVLIDSKFKVIKYPIVGYWVDIGRHEDYLKVQEFSKHLSSNQ